MTIPDLAAGRGAAELSVTFWGVRGSLAVPGAATARYGGNTPCLEVRCGDRRLILDAGTGLRSLGDSYGRSEVSDPIDILLTHTHHDHVSGLPFFHPLYSEMARIRLWGPRLGHAGDLLQVLSTFMSAPFHPVPLNAVQSKLELVDFEVGERLAPFDGVVVRNARLNHPNGAVGYRIDFAGRSICYVTDTEHVPGQVDPAVLELISDTDIVIYDAMFTDEEFERHRGWGHSTWRAGIELADAAGARTLVLFHHAPKRTDDELDRLAVTVDRIRPGTLVAMEGMVLRPTPA